MVASPDRVPGFSGERARGRFLAAYERAFERLWPVPVEAEDAPTGAGTVRVYRAGGRGPNPYVLLPGAGGNALGWYRFVAPLARHRPVIAVDALGEPGASMQTAPVPGPEAAARWLEELLAALGVESGHLVGTSLGGWLAVEHERRFPGRAAALTLADPAGLGRFGWPFYRWLIAGGLAGMLLRGRPRRWAARRLHNATVADDELMRLARAAVAFRRPATPITPWTDEELAAVRVPVQVLLGGRSPWDVPGAVERLARVVPGWRVEVLPEAGHALVMDEPAVVLDRVLGFPPGDGGGDGGGDEVDDPAAAGEQAAAG
jgi:pimeloyl-ACP methyl ester carboxylesterase